ncbi:MAG: RHS repeat-associated core domain-containing protein, partial [Candidatus Hydrogenedentes bacterium]|nr:RHS repeat-associated core domain-containing protein [Candidatus Hydrogenedentota bacterium]
YDGLSRQVSGTMELSPAGATVTTSTAYDANSRIVSRTDPNSRTTQYAHDVFDRMTQVTYADGTAQRMSYNRFGDQTGRTDPTGTTFAQTYDKLGRMTTRTTTPAAGFTNPGTETFEYDALSRMTSAKLGNLTQPTDSLATFLHDSLGNVYSETLEIGTGSIRTTAHVFDDNGNRKKTTYPGGRTVTYTHDALERTASIADGGGTLAEYDYAGGRVARRANGNGTQVDLSYDGIGSANAMDDFGVARVIQTRHTVTSGGAELDEHTFEWDADGNKTRRVDARTGGTTDDYTHAYDGLSRMTARTPDSGSADTFTYDSTGNRTTTGYALEGADALIHAYTKTPVDERGYDRLGNLASYDARARWYTFDAQSRLTGLVEAGTRVEDDFSTVPGAYSVESGTWGVADEVLSESTAATGRILRGLPAGTTDITFSFKSPHDAENTADYDPERYGLFLVRLFEADWKYAALVMEPTGLYLREWDDEVLVNEYDSEATAFQADTWYDVKVAYSGTGNRTVAIYWAKRGDPMPTSTLFSATLSADLAEDTDQQTGFGTGELGDYSYRDVQFRDSLSTSSTRVSEYLYDALGRRIGKTIDPDGTPTVTEYIYDGNQIIEERDGSGNVLASYVYGLYVDEPITMTRGSDDYYYHQDDQHNVVALTDDTGAVEERYAYGVFGDPSIYEADGTTPRATSIASNPFLFTGREWDPELNAYWYRTRYMDPTSGRFISRDTIGLWGDAANLGNPYSYVNNNPWSGVDPFGLERFGEVSYLHDVGNVAKGYFWEGPKGLLAGAWSALVTLGGEIADPMRAAREIGQGVGALGEIVSATESPTRNLLAEGGRQWLREVDQNSDAQGKALFGVSTILAPGVLATKGAKAVEVVQGTQQAAIRARVLENVAESQATVLAKPSGWKLGNPIDELTSKGTTPAWSTVRQRYWKNEALNNPDVYNASNLDRMKRGLAPQRPNPRTGQLESMELHHTPPQREGGMFNLERVWPDDHALVDVFRKTGKK